MGATLIRAAALKTLPKPWFQTVDDTSGIMEGINQITQYTEDLWLCNLLKDSKNPNTGNPWKIAGDFSLLCEHWNLDGNCFYPLDDPATNSKVAVPAGKKKILDIASGEVPYKSDEGVVVTCDFRPEAKPDYVCDMRLLPFATGEFDHVHASHCLEHVRRDEAIETLKEWARVTKPDGVLEIISPDLEWAAKEILNGTLKGDDDAKGQTPHIMNVLYGAQTFRGNSHFCGFTPERLEWFLKQVGFKHFDTSTSGYNIICKASRVPLKAQASRKLLKAAKPTSKKQSKAVIGKKR